MTTASLSPDSFLVRVRRLLSRPGLTTAPTRRTAEGMGGAEPPAATRSAYFGASMARTASSGPSLQRAPWHARLRPEEQAARVVYQGSAPPPPQPRSGAKAVPLSAGPVLRGCSAAAAAPGDSDDGAARRCPGAALPSPVPPQAACSQRSPGSTVWILSNLRNDNEIPLN